MQDIYANKNATRITLLHTTPDVLRDIANRMEMGLKLANAGDYVQIPLTGNITVCSKKIAENIGFNSVSTESLSPEI